MQYTRQEFPSRDQAGVDAVIVEVKALLSSGRKGQVPMAIQMPRGRCLKYNETFKRLVWEGISRGEEEKVPMFFVWQWLPDHKYRWNYSRKLQKRWQRRCKSLLFAPDRRTYPDCVFLVSPLISFFCLRHHQTMPYMKLMDLLASPHSPSHQKLRPFPHILHLHSKKQGFYPLYCYFAPMLTWPWISPN